MKVLNVEERIACVTLDFEKDYGDRIGEFNVLDHDEDLDALASLFSDLDVPLSLFIQTDILSEYPKSLDVVKALSRDHHGHSHTHNTRDPGGRAEIGASAAEFEKHFGHKPLGYRAPQGVLGEQDVDILKECGFSFSASVFPSYRPGRFNNLAMPYEPFVYDNGLLELPFAVVLKLRYIVSLSYLKLLGMPLNKALISCLGLPHVVVLDSHLHDYIVDERSFSRLPPHMKLVYSINKRAGRAYLTEFVKTLRANGYRFMTMTELHNHLVETYV